MAKILKSPAKLFLILALVFGIIWVFLMPAGAGYDEETHLARIYEISRGYLIPNTWLGVTGNGIPQNLLEVSYRQQVFLQPVTKAEIMQGLSVGIKDPDWIAYQTRATYSPIFYLPQALLLVVFGYLLNMPILLLTWLLRLTYLGTYTVTAYFAIQLMPKFKWTLFVLALAPMALIQAVSISADPLTNGLSFLFMAWSLYLVEGKKSINKKSFLVTMFLVFLLFNIKPNSTPLVLLLILLKPVQFSSRRKIVFFWLTIAALFVIEVGSWTLIQSQAEAAWRGQEPIQYRIIISELFGNPAKFIIQLVNYIISNLPAVLHEYVASFGYGYYEMPAMIFPIFWGILAIAILYDWQDESISNLVRIVLFLEFILLFFGTFALRFIIKLSIEGLILTQGRYFIPFIPLSIFSIFGGQLRLRSRIPYLNKIIAISTAMLLSLVTIAMHLVYYVPCGMYIFTPGQCVLPVYKNWGPSPEISLPINEMSTLEQTFQPDCGKLYDLRFFTYLSDDSSLEREFSLSVINLQTKQEVVNHKYSTSIINNGAITILDFPAFNANTNSPYSIRLSSTNQVDSFRIALSDRHRIRGSLSQEGVPIDKDLLFQYRCRDD